MPYDDLPNDGWGVDDTDPLAPARGCINGIIGGALLWVAIGFIVWVIVR